MILKDFMKDYKLKGFEVEYRDFYSNIHKKTDLSPKEILKIENLEIRNVDINFKLKKAKFYLIGLYELMRGDK